jgi:hypothetical protein
MAIHESLPGVEVTICVDGEALKEYEAENEVGKYLEGMFMVGMQQN